MGFWQIILILIQYGPTIFKIIREIIALIKEISNRDDPKNAALVDYEQDIRNALADYRLTKSTEKLENLRSHLRARLGR